MTIGDRLVVIVICLVMLVCALAPLAIIVGAKH